LYFGGFEIFRKRDSSGALILERETLHVMDDIKRIALVETLTVDNGSKIANPVSVQRYQLGNNIESATLELDENAQIISYEEYYPYGETSYQAGRSASEVSQKRYRYTGKEKDEESGLYYMLARYYSGWLGRWTAADPAGMVDGVNLYAYCRGNPVVFLDADGCYSMAQMEDGSFIRFHEDDEENPSTDRVDEVSMNEEWMQSQMKNKEFNPKNEELTDEIRAEWAELARIVLNNEELFVDVADRSEQYEYGAFFNSERKPTFVNLSENSETPDIPFPLEYAAEYQMGSTPNVGKLATDYSRTTIYIPWETRGNEVHGHPTGEGKLSDGDKGRYALDDRYRNTKGEKFVRPGHNMFVVGHKTGKVAVTNRNIKKFGLQQLPIGTVNMNNKRPVYYQSKK
jgi:RHS repeat-associated protein